MAAKKETTTGEVAKEVEEKATEEKQTVSRKMEQAESEYSAQELASNAAQIFDTRSECVAAALKVAGVTRCTISKAKEITKAFMTKEVK